MQYEAFRRPRLFAGRDVPSPRRGVGTGQSEAQLRFALTECCLDLLLRGNVLRRAEAATQRPLRVDLEFGALANPARFSVDDDAMLDVVGLAAKSRIPAFVDVVAIIRMYRAEKRLVGERRPGRQPENAVVLFGPHELIAHDVEPPAANVRDRLRAVEIRAAFPELAHRTNLWRDILAQNDDAADAFIGIVPRPHLPAHPARRAVCLGERVVLGAHHRTSQCALVHSLVAFRQFGMRLVMIPPDQTVEVDAILRSPAPAGRNVAQVTVEHGDRGRRIGNEPPQTLLALAQGQFGATPHPDIAHDGGNAEDAALVVADLCRRQRYVDARAILRHPHGIAHESPPAENDFKGTALAFAGRRLAVRSHQHIRGPADRLFGGIAEQALCGRVPAEDVPLGIEPDHRVVGRFDDRRQLRRGREACVARLAHLEHVEGGVQGFGDGNDKDGAEHERQQSEPVGAAAERLQPHVREQRAEPHRQKTGTTTPENGRDRHRGKQRDVDEPFFQPGEKRQTKTERREHHDRRECKPSRERPIARRRQAPQRGADECTGPRCLKCGRAAFPRRSYGRRLGSRSVLQSKHEGPQVRTPCASSRKANSRRLSLGSPPRQRPAQSWIKAHKFEHIGLCLGAQPCATNAEQMPP